MRIAIAIVIAAWTSLAAHPWAATSQDDIDEAKLGVHETGSSPSPLSSG